LDADLVFALYNNADSQFSLTEVAPRVSGLAWQSHGTPRFTPTFKFVNPTNKKTRPGEPGRAE
tara:strand:- start:137 stop:325 length:189 start_codon:yes stop_codon:yes gene_type:complete